MDIVVNYALQRVAAGLLLIVFFRMYRWATPFDTMRLIRQATIDPRCPAIMTAYA